jgi:hypothetical protein
VKAEGYAVGRVGGNGPGLLVVAAGPAGVEGIGAGVFVGGDVVGLVVGKCECAVFDPVISVSIQISAIPWDGGRRELRSLRICSAKHKMRLELTDWRISPPPRRSTYAPFPNPERI